MLGEANISQLRILWYGLKAPLSSWPRNIQEMFDDSARLPEFDIGREFVGPDPTLVIPPDSPHLKEAFRMLSFAGAGAGGIEYFDEDNNYTKFYSKLAHALKGLTKTATWTAARLNKTARARREQLSALMLHLASDQFSYGGVRLEVRLEKRISDALADAEDRLTLGSVATHLGVDSVDRLLLSFDRASFLLFLEGVMLRAEELSFFSGDSNSPNCQPPKRWYDLYNLFGIARDVHRWSVYKTSTAAEQRAFWIPPSGPLTRLPAHAQPRGINFNASSSRSILVDNILSLSLSSRSFQSTLVSPSFSAVPSTARTPTTALFGNNHGGAQGKVLFLTLWSTLFIFIRIATETKN